MSEADRLAAAEGLLSADGLRIELVEPEPDVYNLAYNVVSNATLWFCHHTCSTRPGGRGPTSGGWTPGTPTAPTTA